MKIRGRSISSGCASGTVLKLENAFSFLGGVDGSTGELRVENGGNVSGRVLVFPRGKGSTVGSFTMYDLKAHGAAPAAIVNASAETIVSTGAVISGIPMIDRIDIGLLKNGDDVTVNGTDGSIELHNVKMTESSSSAIFVNGKVLMLKRPNTASSFPGRWSLVAGKIEGNESPEEAAVREIMEETSLTVGRPSVSSGAVMVRENDTIWKVHMFAFELDSAEPVLNNENTGYEWVLPDDIHEDQAVSLTRECVKKMMKMF